MISTAGLHGFRRFLGIERADVGHPEKLISAAGGFVGILLVLFISARCVGMDSAGLIVASMGASAVLLFAAPHGALSQPWPFAGGHLLSAFAGVLCMKLIPDPWMAGAASVGLAIGLMYYGRCIHPPGGATALTVVLGGAKLHALGFQYMVTPVLLNVLVLLAVAIAVNAPFAWRRYPASLVRRHKEQPGDKTGNDMFSEEHLAYALRSMGSLIDITAEDLAEICMLASQHARGAQLPVKRIRVGSWYENRRGDSRWAVRHIVDEVPGPTADEDVLLYWVVAGHEGRGRGTCTRRAMQLWADRELTGGEAAAIARQVMEAVV